MSFINVICEKLGFLSASSYQNMGSHSSIRSTISITGDRLSKYILLILLLFWFVITYSIDSSHQFLIVNIFIFLFSLIYYKVLKSLIFSKKTDRSNLDYYNRELPSNLKPAHVRMLLNDGLVDDMSLAAPILDLIDRGYLSINTIKKEEFFSKQFIISTTNKDQSDLLSYEKFVITWLFNNGSISSDDLKTKLRNPDNNPGDDFNIFHGLVLLSFPYSKYYTTREENAKKIVACIVSIVFLFVFLKVFYLFSFLYICNIISFLLAIFIVNYVLLINKYKLNKNGKIMINEYLKLKKFLDDFSSISEKNSENIVLWDYYLPYSISLGIYGVASKEISDFFGYEIHNSYKDLNNKSHLYIKDIYKYIEEGNNYYNKRASN